MLVFCSFFGILNIIGCVLFLTTFPFNQVVSVVTVMFSLFVFFFVMMITFWLMFVAGGAGDRLVQAHYRVMQMLRRPLVMKTSHICLFGARFADLHLFFDFCVGVVGNSHTRDMPSNQPKLSVHQ
jgi:hypothetical protein